jgi:hypothetical protein
VTPTTLSTIARSHTLLAPKMQPPAVREHKRALNNLDTTERGGRNGFLGCVTLTVANCSHPNALTRSACN